MTLTGGWGKVKKSRSRNPAMIILVEPATLSFRGGSGSGFFPQVATSNLRLARDHSSISNKAGKLYCA